MKKYETFFSSRNTPVYKFRGIHRFYSKKLYTEQPFDKHTELQTNVWTEAGDNTHTPGERTSAMNYQTTTSSFLTATSIYCDTEMQTKLETGVTLG